MKRVFLYGVIVSMISPGLLMCRLRIEDTNNQQASRKVTLVNSIQKDSLAYKSIFGTFSPTTFIVSINGKEIKEKENQTIDAIDNKVTVRFDASFLNGYRTTARELTFEVAQGKSSYDVTFSWDLRHRIGVKDGQLVRNKKVKYKEWQDH